MTLLDDAMLAARVSDPAFEPEVQMLVDSAKADMVRCGVDADMVDAGENPLVRQAVTAFVKARFGFDNPDAARLDEIYRLSVIDLMNSPSSAKEGR